MGKKISEKNHIVIKSGIFGKTKQLGRVLSHEGVTEILYSLNERPKQYKDFIAEIDLSNSTLERALKELLAYQIIKKMPITSNKRETHQYDLTPIGVELMRFIWSYEKIITIPISQQKIVETE